MKSPCAYADTVYSRERRFSDFTTSQKTRRAYTRAGVDARTRTANLDG